MILQALSKSEPPGWILVHHPFWGIRPRDGAEVNRTEQAAWHQFPIPDPFPGLRLVLSGHIHEFSSVSFQPFDSKKGPPKQRPAQWIVGSGGDNLELEPPYLKQFPDKVVDDVKANVFTMEGFGFLVLERNSEPTKWTGTLLDTRNHVLAKCWLDGRSLSCEQPGGSPSK